MNKICTSLEQSKKLIELGINVNTADMYYSFDYNIKEYDEDAQIIPKSELGQHFSLFPEDVAAWSLTALFDILPKQFDEYVKTLYWFNGEYHCSYENENWESKYWTSADNLIDACFKMILKLREYEKLYRFRTVQKVG